MARVLIVDDEMTILIVEETILKCAGYETVACNDSAKAMDLLKSSGFDVMISDIRMKPIDGIQLLKAANALKPPVPVVLVSAYEYPPAGMDAKELGAVAHLRKPFGNKDLLRCVETALARDSKKQ